MTIDLTAETLVDCIAGAESFESAVERAIALVDGILIPYGAPRAAYIRRLVAGAGKTAGQKASIPDYTKFVLALLD